MANQFRINNVVATVMANAFDDECNTDTPPATIEIKTGSQPATPDDAETGTVLAVLTMSNPAFGGAADATPGAILTASAITDDSSADATGTAAHFVILTGTADTHVASGTVGTSGADLNLNSVAITSGSAVAITSMTVTMRETE